jgi:hypothetical protein
MQYFDTFRGQFPSFWLRNATHCTERNNNSAAKEIKITVSISYIYLQDKWTRIISQENPKENKIIKT